MTSSDAPPRREGAFQEPFFGMFASTSSLFSWLARLVLIATLIAAPWPFGSYPLDWQPPVFAGILVSLVLWWLSVVTRPGADSEGRTILVDGLLPPVLLVVAAAMQLIPFANVPDVPPHAVLAAPARAEISASVVADPMPISVARPMTRLSAAHLLLAICAAFLGIQLFGDARRRMWLYVPLAINAAILAAFGMWQNAHWDEWN